jgi:hypothetical protein
MSNEMNVKHFITSGQPEMTADQILKIADVRQYTLMPGAVNGNVHRWDWIPVEAVDGLAPVLTLDDAESLLEAANGAPTYRVLGFEVEDNDGLPGFWVIHFDAHPVD